MRDKISEDFLNKLKRAAGTLCDNGLKEIEANFEENLTKIGEGLAETIKKGVEQYQKRKAKGEVGSLNYVYFSYLRTSILCGSPDYRLDFYEEDDRSSLTECAVPWNFSYVFDHFERLKKELRLIHNSPNRVPGYELDDILYKKAELFKREAEEKLAIVLCFVLENHGTQLLEGEQVKFYVGEFLDEASLVFYWNGDAIETFEEGKRNA